MCRRSSLSERALKERPVGSRSVCKGPDGVICVYTEQGGRSQEQQIVGLISGQDMGCP
jgi:hypothetical protein